MKIDLNSEYIITVVLITLAKPIYGQCFLYMETSQLNFYQLISLPNQFNGFYVVRYLPQLNGLIKT